MGATKIHLKHLAKLGLNNSFNAEQGKITNALPATALGEYVTFEQLGNVSASAQKYLKEPVRLAETIYAKSATYNATTMTLTSTINQKLSIDGLDANIGDRVLLTQQADKKTNGIFIVVDNGSGSTPWILDRSDDADASSKVQIGLFVKVSDGMTMAGQEFILSGTSSLGDPTQFELDIDEMNFERSSGLGMVSIGAGLTATVTDDIAVLAKPNGGIKATTSGIEVLFRRMETLTATANPKVFTKANAVLGTELITIQGLCQIPSEAYTAAYDVNGDLEITFSTAPEASDVSEGLIRITYMAKN